MDTQAVEQQAQQQQVFKCQHSKKKYGRGIVSSMMTAADNVDTAANAARDVHTAACCQQLQHTQEALLYLHVAASLCNTLCYDKCILVTAGDVMTSPSHKLLLCCYSSCIEFFLEFGYVAVNRAKRIERNVISRSKCVKTVCTQGLSQKKAEQTKLREYSW